MLWVARLRRVDGLAAAAGALHRSACLVRSIAAKGAGGKGEVAGEEVDLGSKFALSRTCACMHTGRANPIRRPGTVHTQGGREHGRQARVRVTAAGHCAPLSSLGASRWPP